MWGKYRPLHFGNLPNIKSMCPLPLLHCHESYFGFIWQKVKQIVKVHGSFLLRSYIFEFKFAHFLLVVVVGYVEWVGVC